MKKYFQYKLLFLSGILLFIITSGCYAGKQKNYLSNIQIFGTLVGSYTYNFANTSAINTPTFYEGNGNYGNNWQPRGFTINNMDITVKKAPGNSSNPYGIGFKISLDTGQNIQFYKAYYSNLFYFTSPFENRYPFDIRKAYLDIYVPVGSGLDIHIGKEKELLGFENFNPIRNWNNTYSLLDAVEPSTFTGVFLTYNFVPRLSSTFGVANTINAVVPIDKIPVIEVNESYTATKKLTFNGGFIYGPNSYFIAGDKLYKDNSNKSFYSYINGEFSPYKDWSFVLDGELGIGGGINQSILSSNGISPDKVIYPTLVETSGSAYDQSRFYGIAGYIHHRYNYSFGKISETLRETAAYDKNGLWEPISTPGVNTAYIDSTLTFAYTPSGFKNFQLRLELEHQQANHDIYLNSSGVPAKSQQNTVNFMVLYSF